MLPIPDVTLHPEDSRAHMRLADSLPPVSRNRSCVVSLVALIPAPWAGAPVRRRTIRPERLPVIDLLIVSHRHPDHMTWLARPDGRDCEELCPPDPVIVGTPNVSPSSTKGSQGDGSGANCASVGSLQQNQGSVSRARSPAAPFEMAPRGGGGRKVAALARIRASISPNV